VGRGVRTDPAPDEADPAGVGGMSARWSAGWALVHPVEVRQVGNLTWIEGSRLPVALVSRPVDVGDHQGEVDDRVVEGDPLAAALAELADTARARGRPLGRRTVARELGVTEYRAGQLLLARATTNGDGSEASHERSRP